MWTPATPSASPPRSRRRAPGGSVAAHPDGASVLVRKQLDGGRQDVELWDLRADPPMKRQVLKHTGGSIDRILMTRDGKQAATASGGEVFIWDLATGLPLL